MEEILASIRTIIAEEREPARPRSQDPAAKSGSRPPPQIVFSKANRLRLPMPPRCRNRQRQRAKGTRPRWFGVRAKRRPLNRRRRRPQRTRLCSLLRRIRPSLRPSTRCRPISRPAAPRSPKSGARDASADAQDVARREPARARRAVGSRGDRPGRPGNPLDRRRSSRKRQGPEAWRLRGRSDRDPAHGRCIDAPLPPGAVDRPSAFQDQVKQSKVSAARLNAQIEFNAGPRWTETRFQVGHSDRFWAMGRQRRRRFYGPYPDQRPLSFR